MDGGGCYRKKITCRKGLDTGKLAPFEGTAGKISGIYGLIQSFDFILVMQRYMTFKKLEFC